ncbi:hypothetical protein CRG98_015580 [Punica granatum]|uniref:Reverse transcriptase Ty1/copia-type domain-containing protein n=1 Tax=Punica granatum TaxID=22663 RepID=A0A2I0K682_PUNGR|nr:hypothetical protein CRG98_015580 [Punica granatum]
MNKVPYSSTVGSLMYAMVCTRLVIVHSVDVVSRFLSNPGKEHWNAVKWILRYFKGTPKVFLHFGTGKPELVGYTNADMAGDIDSRKSTSGYLMTFAGGSYLMAIKASIVHHFVYNGTRIHCGDRRLQGDVVVAKVFAGVELKTRKIHLTGLANLSSFGSPKHHEHAAFFSSSCNPSLKSSKLDNLLSQTVSDQPSMQTATTHLPRRPISLPASSPFSLVRWPVAFATSPRGELAGGRAPADAENKCAENK